MTSCRHKWTKNTMTDIPFVATYKVDVCARCGCLRLHKYEGKMHFSAYVIGGTEYNKLPECKTNKPLI